MKASLFLAFSVSSNKLLEKSMRFAKKSVVNLKRFKAIALATFAVQVNAFEQIPGPKRVPLIGNRKLTALFAGEYSIDRLHENGFYNLKTYGPLVREEVGSKRFLHVFDVHDMETVIRAESRYPYRRSHRALLKYRREKSDLYSSGGLFPENGEEWYRFRKLFQQTLLNQENVNAYVEQFESVTEQLIESIKNRRNDKLEVIDFEEDLFLWALENIAIMSLDARLASLSNRDKVQPLVKAAHSTHDAVVKTELSQFELWKFMATKAYRKLCKSQNVMENVILPLFQKKVKEQSEHNCRQSIVAQFLQNRNASEKDVFTVIMDLFLAGIDTNLSKVSNYCLPVKYTRRCLLNVSFDMCLKE
ncbi:cytochrome P450-like protein 26 [Leptotrombidium deliense]|uniref:Cytochrome P450-like protein 26 n=1 Tax=Leptotrombidium deliense TaxID=299467 RepID=A0A443SV99_9ACAR|nr:cytochrome P450-like protein 26 [Leptotrombidium deliense]